VFTRPGGGAYHPQRLSKMLGDYTQELGLPRLTAHGLRHTSATLMLASGVAPKVAAERLGHADPTPFYQPLQPRDSDHATRRRRPDRGGAVRPGRVFGTAAGIVGGCLGTGGCGVDLIVGVLEETLLAEAHRQLDGQLTELDGLRTRAVSVLGAAGVIAGLFVGRLGSSIDGFAWAALGLLLSTVAAAVWVILPQQLASAQDLRSALAWYERYRDRPEAATCSS